MSANAAYMHAVLYAACQDAVQHCHGSQRTRSGASDSLGSGAPARRPACVSRERIREQRPDEAGGPPRCRT